MQGHYHAEIHDKDTGTVLYINETSFNAFRVMVDIAKRSRNLRVRKVKFVCQYGCGQLHKLTLAEMKTLRDPLEWGPTL